MHGAVNDRKASRHRNRLVRGLHERRIGRNWDLYLLPLPFIACYILVHYRYPGRPVQLRDGDWIGGLQKRGHPLCLCDTALTCGNRHAFVDIAPQTDGLRFLYTTERYIEIYCSGR